MARGKCTSIQKKIDEKTLRVIVLGERKALLPLALTLSLSL